jgi:hypothetical protein
VQAELELAASELLWGADPATPASAWFADEAEGWLLYRELAREKLVGSLASMLERTAAELGARFDHDVSDFLAARGAGGRHLHQVMRAFVEHAAERWRRDASLPAHLSELARHEALELELAAYPGRASPPSEAPLGPEAGLAFDPTCRIVRYGHAVQRADEDCAPPERRSTTLLVFRDAEHEVCWRELDLAERLLLEALFAGRSLRTSLESVRAQIRSDGSLVLQCARVLAELAEQGAIVGPCAAVD